MLARIWRRKRRQKAKAKAKAKAEAEIRTDKAKQFSFLDISRFYSSSITPDSFFTLLDARMIDINVALSQFKKKGPPTLLVLDIKMRVNLLRIERHRLMVEEDKNIEKTR